MSANLPSFVLHSALTLSSATLMAAGSEAVSESATPRACSAQGDPNSSRASHLAQAVHHIDKATIDKLDRYLFIQFGRAGHASTSIRGFDSGFKSTAKGHYAIPALPTMCEASSAHLTAEPKPPSLQVQRSIDCLFSWLGWVFLSLSAC